MALRPYWSGQIRLSLVSFPVEVFLALNRSRQIPLHEVYRKTGERIHHKNVAGDKEVDRDDIVKAYEIEKGEYVIIEPEEIQALKIPSKKTLDIVQFVNADAIDEIYYETPYFVVPGGKDAQDAFGVIRDALRASGKVGLGQLAIGGRERLCSLKPCGTGLLLETMRYEDEIRASDPFFADIHKSANDKEQLDLAKELIKRKTSSFKPEKFHDHYRDALKELIDSKREHRKPREVVAERQTGKVINLMDALRRSLKGDKEPGGKKSAAGKPQVKSKKTSHSGRTGGRKKAS